MDFRNDDGIWKYRGITGFDAVRLNALGSQGMLDDYYGEAGSLRYNCSREFLMWNNTGYSPLSDNNYYGNLEAHWVRQQERGFYVHAVLFCDQVGGSRVLLSNGAQDDHVRRCVEIARRVGTVILEVNNEDFKNGQISARFPADGFSGVMTTRSTWEDNGQDPQTPGTWLDWATFHTPRTADFPVKSKVLHEMQVQGLDKYPPARLPSVSGEPRRIAEGTTPDQHRDDAFIAEMFGAGSCCHGGWKGDASHQSWLQSCIWPGPGPALDCIRARADVWNNPTVSIPDYAAGTGSYVRGQENGGGECPIEHRDRDLNTGVYVNGAVRSYFMVNGGQCVGIAAMPGPEWKLVTRLGWRTYAVDGNRMLLVR